MQAIYYLLALIAIFEIIVAAWEFNRSEELDEREEELDKMSVHLDGRANRIAAEEQTLNSEWQLLRMAKDAIDNADVFTSTYTVTDSDLIKFDDDKHILAYAKDKIAKAIAHDILKRYELCESKNEEGRKVLSMRFYAYTKGEQFHNKASK